MTTKPQPTQHLTVDVEDPRDGQSRRIDSPPPWRSGQRRQACFPFTTRGHAYSGLLYWLAR